MYTIAKLESHGKESRSEIICAAPGKNSAECARASERELLRSQQLV